MKKFLIGACALGILAACGQRGAEPSAPQQDSSANAPAASTEGNSGAGAQRLVSYKRSMLGLVSGSYSGNCASLTGTAPKEGVAISSAGLATAQGWQHDLMQAGDVFTLSRTERENTPVSASLLVRAKEPESMLAIESGAEASVTYGAGAAATKCRQVPVPVRLRDKSLYPAVSSFFIAGNTALTCVDATGSRELAVEAGPAGVTVGGRPFSFERGMQSEMASVDGVAHTLTYRIVYENGENISMSIDDSGKISDLVAVSKGEANYTCGPKP